MQNGFTFEHSTTFLKSVQELIDRFERAHPAHKKRIERLNKELEIINSNGFVKCYIQVHDIIKLVKDRGIPHILRGSAGCSYVAYLMGIHDIDPIKHDIPLERFLNWTREDQPDFDIDLPHRIRDKVLDRLKIMYPDRVGRISNKVMYREKSALRQAVRDFGYKKRLPKYFKLEDLFDDQQVIGKVKSRAHELEGTQRMWMKHCGGVVIFDDKIPDDLRMSPTSNQIRVDKRDVEDLGWIKIDVLSNRGLSQLWELDDRRVSEYPMDDSKARDLICRGDVIGLTQAESRTMRKALISLQPQNAYEVALALALIRPAAAAGGRKAKFLKEKKSSHIIYDEDAIQFIAETIGCSYSEADKFRRGFSKGKDHIIREFTNRLYEARIKDKSGIVDELSYLKKYSFSKGHAIAYGQVVWSLAYHKARDPKSFWESTLEHCHSAYRKWVHKREAIYSGVILKNKFVGTSVEQFVNTGWWDTKEFLPGMGIDVGDDGKVYFKGVISTYKRLRYGKNGATLVTVGVEDNGYIDLTLKKNFPLGYYTIIEGRGSLKEDGGYSWIEVDDFNATNFYTRHSKKLSNKFFTY